MITGNYDRQLDRSNRSKNVRDLALGLVNGYELFTGHLDSLIPSKKSKVNCFYNSLISFTILSRVLFKFLELFLYSGILDK
jgi:hypothetical protein